MRLYNLRSVGEASPIYIATKKKKNDKAKKRNKQDQKNLSTRKSLPFYTSYMSNELP